MEQIPLFPDPSDHQAFVRMVELPWPLAGFGYVVVCPGCQDRAGAVHAAYETAHDRALAHRLDRSSYVPAGVIPWGPRSLWGVSRKNADWPRSSTPS